MYINEKSWEVHLADNDEVHNALMRFIKLYATMGKKYGAVELLIPENVELSLYSNTFILEKWLAQLQHLDKDAYRVFMSFWARKIVYQIDDEYEFIAEGSSLIGAMEAAINDSFVISLCVNTVWKREKLEGNLYSLSDDTNRQINVDNLYTAEQLSYEPFNSFFNCKKLKIYSYAELWEKRERLFLHLEFCPSVEKNLFHTKL